MVDSVAQYDALIRSGARRLTGYQRRLFQAEVATALCGGCARQAERRFGWGRETVQKGLHELQHGIRCLENFAARGRQRGAARRSAAKRRTRNWPPTSAPSSRPLRTPIPNSSRHGGTPRASAHFYDDLVNFAALRPLV